MCICGNAFIAELPVELPKVPSLSEIVLDQDKQALDSFLGTIGEPEDSTGNC